MNKLLNIIFCFSIGLIGIWLFRRPLFWLIGLEFSDYKIEFEYCYSWRYMLPFAVLLTLAKDFSEIKEPKKIILSVLGRTLLAGISVIAVYFSLFSMTRGWIEKEVYFVSKNDTGKISLMEYGCGAYDSDSNSTQKIKKITPMTANFNWVHSTDTSDVNLNEWVRVE